MRPLLVRHGTIMYPNAYWPSRRPPPDRAEWRVCGNKCHPPRTGNKYINKTHFSYFFILRSPRNTYFLQCYDLGRVRRGYLLFRAFFSVSMLRTVRAPPSPPPLPFRNVHSHPSTACADYVLETINTLFIRPIIVLRCPKICTRGLVCFSHRPYM